MTASGPAQNRDRLQQIQAVADSLQAESRSALEEEVRATAQVANELLPKPPRRLILAEYKALMYEEQDGLCGICGHLMDSLESTDIDHVVPHTHGGGNERTNLQLTHTSCNRSKRHQVDPVELLESLQGRYRNRPLRD